MKRLLLIAFYLLCFFVVSHLMRSLVNQGLLESNAGQYAKLSRILVEKGNGDLLFLGSSRVEAHFDAAQLPACDSLQVFNAGLGACQLALSHVFLKHYLRNGNRPSYLFVGLDFTVAQAGVDDITYHQRFIPYLEGERGEELAALDGRLWRSKYLPFYAMSQYNDQQLHAAWRGATGQYILHDRSYVQNGFVPAPERGHARIAVTPQQLSCSQKELAALEGIIALAKEHDIRIAFVAPPLYHEQREGFKGFEDVRDVLHASAQQHNIPYFDYSDHPICLDQANFADATHLNALGVKRFSAAFSNDISFFLSE